MPDAQRIWFFEGVIADAKHSKVGKGIGEVQKCEGVNVVPHSQDALTRGCGFRVGSLGRGGISEAA